MLLSSSPLNGHTSGFHPQSQNLKFNNFDSWFNSRQEKIKIGNECIFFSPKAPKKEQSLTNTRQHLFGNQLMKRKDADEMKVSTSLLVHTNIVPLELRIEMMDQRINSTAYVKVLSEPMNFPLSVSLSKKM